MDETVGKRAAPERSGAALRLVPDHGLPVGRQNQVAARIDLDPVAAGFVGVEVEALTVVVLGGARFDEDAVLAQDVGGPQHVLSIVDPQREMVQPPMPALHVEHVRELMMNGARAHPGAELGRTLVEDDLLAQLEAQQVGGEAAVGRNVRRQQRQMVDPAHADAVTAVPLRLVLEHRAFGCRRLVALLFEVDFHRVAIGIVKAVGSAVPIIAVTPADAEPRRVERGRPPLEGGRARRAPGYAAHTWDA